MDQIYPCTIELFAQMEHYKELINIHVLSDPHVFFIMNMQVHLLTPHFDHFVSTSKHFIIQTLIYLRNLFSFFFDSQLIIGALNVVFGFCSSAVASSFCA
jgi:hypothetical protein